MFTAGIDVGRKGGISLLDTDSGEIQVWPMPPEQHRGICLSDLHGILSSFPKSTAVGLESNTCRPEEVPDFAMRFGIQTGELRAMLFCQGLETLLVPPATWMNKLGLTGKQHDPDLDYRMAFVKEHYPYAEPLLLGPHGGIQDGLLEALLISHYIKLMRHTPLGKKSGPKPPKFRGLEPE